MNSLRLKLVLIVSTPEENDDEEHASEDDEDEDIFHPKLKISLKLWRV